MVSFRRPVRLEKGRPSRSIRNLKISLAVAVVGLVIAGQIIFFVGAIRDSGAAVVTGNTPSLHGSLLQKLNTTFRCTCT